MAIVELEFSVAYTIILLTCLLGFLFGIYNGWAVLSIDTSKLPEVNESQVESENLNDSKKEDTSVVSQKNIDVMNLTAEKIQSV